MELETLLFTNKRQIYQIFKLNYYNLINFFKKKNKKGLFIL